MKHFAVVGHPVQHSRSPAIHLAFARQFGHSIRYERLHAAPGAFSDVVQAFRAGGGAGLNVTLPFKLEAYALCQELGRVAMAAGAVNTLLFREDICFGENTDGLGLVEDLTKRLGFALEGASILIFGAGGASRGVLAPLFEAGCIRVTLVNRNVQKARQVCSDFRQVSGLWRRPSDGGPFLECASYDELALEAGRLSGDLLINATSAGLQAQPLPIPSAIFEAAKLAYDMVYAARPTPFMQQAIQDGCPGASDGLGMLVGQAAHAYALWHGVKPEIEPVYQEIRAAIDVA